MPGNVGRFAEDWSLPLQEVQLWVCLRELTMHAVLSRPGVRSSLMTLLGDASAHAAAAQRSIVERLGDGLGDQASLEEALGDPEALLSDLISPEQRNISAALTAQTTAIGAYVDHITAGIAEKLTSSPSALREAWYRYRIEEGKGEQAFAGLFGLNVGQEEVDRGRAFVTGVLERADERALHAPVVRRARPADPRRGRRARPVARPHRAAGLSYTPRRPTGDIARGSAVRQVARQPLPPRWFSPPGRACGAAGPAGPAHNARWWPARHRSSRARSG